MLSRRQFLKQMSLGVSAGAFGLPITGEPFLPKPFYKPKKEIQIALVADSHLPNGSPETVQAKNLQAAVEEINNQNPPVDLVFFAGDLTDHGNKEAVELGITILSGLNPPCWLVPGEHDLMSASRPKPGDCGNIVFSFAHEGLHFLGCNTSFFNPATGSVDFIYSNHLHGALVRELAAIPPETPMIIVTHAPPYRLFKPWQWWTQACESLYNLLESRQKVYLLHGHVHQNIALGHQNLTFQGLRSTAWPLPDVRMGISATQSFHGGNDCKAGCGWMLLTSNRQGSMTMHDMVWGGSEGNHLYCQKRENGL